MKLDQGGVQSISDKKLPPSFATGVHQIRMMVTKSSVKCYVDNERLVNAPKSEYFKPTSFAISIHGDDVDFEKEKIFFRNFRFAEGGKTMREQLDESGHIVTHGIYFDMNSDKIRGESYKTLADIAQMMTDDATLKLMIEGHTDSDGNDASNLELSERRAKSVRQHLIDTYKVSEDRLESKGLGETKPIDANTTPEGKANNRRVELVKM
jgi:outer membrane protein OmpA-like peptidoglycan-associated protein